MRILILGMLFIALLYAQTPIAFKGTGGETILSKQGQCEYNILSYVNLPKAPHTPIFQSWWELPILQRHFRVPSDYMRAHHYRDGIVYSVAPAGRYLCRYHIAEWVGIDPVTGKKEDWIQNGYK